MNFTTVSQKKQNYQPRAYMAMLKREGRFRLLRSKLSKDVRIWHNCDTYGDADLEKRKTIWEVLYGGWYKESTNEELGRWQCSMCGEPAPDGIVGIYIMMDWDRATNEISDWQPYEYKYSDKDGVPF